MVAAPPWYLRSCQGQKHRGNGGRRQEIGSTGTKDEHLPLGGGTIHKSVYKRCFDMGVPAVLEMNSLEDIRNSLAYLQENITSD